MNRKSIVLFVLSVLVLAASLVHNARAQDVGTPEEMREAARGLQKEMFQALKEANAQNWSHEHFERVRELVIMSQILEGKSTIEFHYHQK